MSRSENETHVDRRRFLSGLMAGSQLAICACSSRLGNAADPKRIYIAADDHTDYMWTADEAEYRQAFLETLDHYLDLADQTDASPKDFQSRWNCDGLLWFREFEQHRTEQQLKRLVRRIKSGHISVPMTMLVSCYGGAPTEAVLRGLYYGGHVERQHDLRLRIAVSMENQTLPYGLAVLWAGSGVRYSWKGICGCASKLDNAGDREHDVYWWTGPDGSRILMKWYSLAPKLRDGLHPNEGPGGYAEARDPAVAIEYVDTNAGFRRRNPHQVIGLFGQGWDDLKTIVKLKDSKRSFPVVAKAKSTQSRRVIVSNEHDYFDDMSKTHGRDLPEVKAAFGNEWDLYSASLAEVSAAVKRATEKLRAAESMAAMVAMQQSDFADELTPLRDQAWIAYGLYWEHDWTADGPISKQRRTAWQRKIAGQIISYVDALHERARAALAKLISSPTSDRVFVFNPLGWPRSDIAELEVENSVKLAVVDLATGAEIPSQINDREGTRWLRFIAEDIPACGYRVFRLRPAKTADDAGTISFDDGLLTSKYHQLRVLGNGAITQWKSLLHDRELIRRGQLANSVGPGSAAVTVESSGTISTTIRVDISEPLARTTRITLFESLERIEFDNIITQNFSDVMSWQYEFDLSSPSTYHEEVGSVLQAAFQKDGGPYADRNARTDWLTMNHFVAMHDDAVAVTLSNSDCQFFHLGTDITKPLDHQSNQLHILAGGQIDGPKLGIRSQGGDTRFLQRFALSAGQAASKYDRSASMRFALEHQNRFVVGRIEPSTGALPHNEYGLIQFESDSVLPWAIKPAEEGIDRGLVVRLWNLDDQPCRYRLSTTRQMSSCRQLTHVETDAEVQGVVAGAITERLQPGAMRTLLCSF